MLNPNPIPILSSASSPNTVIRDEVSYVENDDDEISGHNHHQQDLYSEVANGSGDIDGEMSEQTSSQPPQPQQPDLYILDVTNQQQCNIEEQEEEEVIVDQVQDTYDRTNSSNSREQQSRRRSSGPGLPSAEYQLEINKSRQQFDTIRQLFEQTYKRTVNQTNTASVVSRSQSRQSVHFADDFPDFVATSMSRSNVGNSSVMSDDQELMLIPANTVLSFVNFFESKYPSSVGHKTSSNVKSSSRRKAPPVPPTTPHPVSNDDKDPPIWLDKAKHPLEDELKKTNPVARNTSTGSRSSSSFKSTTTTTTATSSSSNFEDSSTAGSSNRLFNGHLEKSKPKVKIHRQSNLPTKHSSFIDYFDPIGPNHNDVNNNTFLHNHHHHHEQQPHKETTKLNGFISINQDSTKNGFNDIESDVHRRDKFHDADDEAEEEEEEVPIEHRFKSDNPLDKTQFTKCDIRINVGKSSDQKQRNRIKTRQLWRYQQRRQRRTKKRGPTTLRPVSIELNLFNQSDITSSSEDQSTSSPVPSLPSKYRYQLHILSQNLRSIFTQLFELDAYPRTYRAYNRRSSQFGQDPAEWKRKAIYRRNLSSIDQYLQKNLSQSSGSNNVFQSNFPWKTFVINSRFHTRIESLSESEIKLYESIFEIIMTERSYLNHLEELKEFPSKNAAMIGQLSKYDQNVLFGNVNLIYSANRDLYEQFVVAFGKSIFMSEVIVILSIFLSGQGSKKFEPYIDYVRAQNERSRLMQDETLMAKCGHGGGVSSGAGTGNGKTLNLAQLQGLLITPMQRITRYPILLGAIRDRLLKIISKSDNSNATSEPNGSNETVPNVDSSSASPSPTPSPQSTVDRRRQSNPQPPAHQLLLSLVEQCWENAKRFAQKCNQALDNQNNLLELIEFKKRLVGDLGFELVSTERKIVTRVSVLVSKKYPNHSTMMNSTVSSASSLLMTLNHKCILIMLSDLLILAVDKQKKKNKFILLNNAPWNLVEYRKGLPQPSINNNQSNSSTPTAVPSQPEVSATFSHQDSSTPSLHSTMEYESSGGGSIADPMTPMVSMPMSLSIPTPPPPPPPPTTGPSLLIGTIKFTKNSNDTVYLVSFPSSEIEEKFSTELNRLKSQN